MFRKQEVEKVVIRALEFSLYVCPRSPGLTREEVREVGRRLNLDQGEVTDAVNDLIEQEKAKQRMGSSRVEPCADVWWDLFSIRFEPDFRNPNAFEFVHTELRTVIRQVGRQVAKLDRSVLVQRAVMAGLSELDVEVAITMLIGSEVLSEKDGALSYRPGKESFSLPSQQLENSHEAGRTDPARREIYEVVRDVIERRTDNRPVASEPLEAFTKALDQLGYGVFKMWWSQMVAELRRLDVAATPVAVTVISAALVEGSLTFIVKHARSLNMGLFKSTDYDKPERFWKIDDLIKSASTGSADAVFDSATQVRATQLALTRQRIHAGRVLSDSPGGVPDLRPEEARDAKQIADTVVRRILDWLHMHPVAK